MYYFKKFSLGIGLNIHDLSVTKSAKSMKSKT